MNSNPGDKDFIQVAVRVRPLIKREIKAGESPVWGWNSNEVYALDDTGKDCFIFDYVLGTESTNHELYNFVKPIVEEATHGINGTVFAYGQTSSGKTHSIMGDADEPGIIPLAINDIFAHIEANNTNRKFLIRACYMEIYNEKINDLLDVTARDLRIREDLQGVVSVKAKEEITRTRDELIKVVTEGNKNRQIGETQMNDRSSRSHVILQIIIESSEDDGNNQDAPVQVSSLFLVDLAGSERVAQTKATGTRLKEGGHINKSLSVLSLVMQQLSSKQEHISFRDSKLTRILSNALGGNAKTLIIATITPVSFENTVSTLQFAKCAKTIMNRPRVNEILTESAMIKRYQQKEKQLIKELTNEKEKNITLQIDRTVKDKKIKHLQEMLTSIRKDFVACKTTTLSKIPKRRHTSAFELPKKPVLSATPTTFRKPLLLPKKLPSISDEVFTPPPAEEFRTPTSKKVVTFSPQPTETPVSVWKERYKHLDESHLNLKEFQSDELEVAITYQKELEIKLEKLKNKLATAEHERQKSEDLMKDYQKKFEQRDITCSEAELQLSFLTQKHSARERDLLTKLQEHTQQLDRYKDLENEMYAMKREREYMDEMKRCAHSFKQQLEQLETESVELKTQRDRYLKECEELKTIENEKNRYLSKHLELLVNDLKSVQITLPGACAIKGSVHENSLSPSSRKALDVDFVFQIDSTESREKVEEELKYFHAIVAECYKLKSNLTDLKTALDEQNKLIQEKNSTIESLENLNKELDDLNDAERTKSNFARTPEDFNQTSADYDRVQKELKQTKDAFAGLQDELKQANIKYNQVQKELAQTKDSFARIQEELKQANIDYNQVLNELEQTKDCFARWQDEANSDCTPLQKELEQTKDSFARLQEELKQVNIDYNRTQMELEKYKDDFDRIKDGLKQLNVDYDQVKTALDEQKKIIEEKHSTIEYLEDFKKELDDLKRLIEEKETAINMSSTVNELDSPETSSRDLNMELEKRVKEVQEKTAEIESLIKTNTGIKSAIKLLSVAMEENNVEIRSQIRSSAGININFGETSVNEFNDEIKHIWSNLTARVLELDELKNQLVEKDKKINEFSINIEKLQLILATKEHELQSGKSHLDKLKSNALEECNMLSEMDNSALKSQLHLMEGELAHLKNQILDQTNTEVEPTHDCELEILKSSLELKQLQLVELQKKFKEERTKVAEQAEIIERTNANLDVLKSSFNVNALNEDENNAKMASLRATPTKKEQEIVELKKRLSISEHKYKEVQKEVEEVTDELMDKISLVEQHEKTIVQHEKSIEQFVNTIEQYEKTVIQHEKSIVEHKETIIQLDNIISQHKETISKHEKIIEQHGNTTEQHLISIVRQDEFNNTILQHEETILQYEKAIHQYENIIEQHVNTINQFMKSIVQKEKIISKYEKTIEQHVNTTEQHLKSIAQREEIIAQHEEEIELHEKTIDQYKKLSSNEGEMVKLNMRLKITEYKLDQVQNEVEEVTDELKDKNEQDKKTIEQLVNTIEQHKKIITQHINTIEQHEKSIVQHNETIDQHVKTIIQHENMIAQQEKTIDRHEKTNIQQKENISQQEKTIDQQKKIIQQQMNTLDKHMKSIVQQEEIISKHEKTIEQHEETIAQHGKTIYEYKNTIEQHVNAIDQHVKSIAQQEETNMKHEKTIEQCEEMIAHHEKTIEQHKETIAQHEKTIEQHVKIIEQHAGTIDQHVKSIAQQDDNISKHEKTIRQCQETIDQHEKTIEQHVKSIAQQEKIIIQHMETIEQREKTIEELKGDDALESVKIQLVETQVELKQIRYNYNQSLSDLKKAQDGFNRTQAKLIQTNADFLRVQKDLEHSNDCLARANEDLEQTKVDFARTLTEFNQVSADYDQVQTELKQTKDAFTRTQDELKQASVDYNQVQNELEQSKDSFAQLQDELKQANIDYNHVKKELEQTKDYFAQSQIEANYNLLQKELEQTKDDLKQSKVDYDQVQKELEQSKNDLIQTQAALKTASQDLNQLKAELDLAQQDLDQLKEMEAMLREELCRANEEIDSLRMLQNDLQQLMDDLSIAYMYLERVTEGTGDTKQARSECYQEEELKVAKEKLEASQNSVLLLKKQFEESMKEEREHSLFNVMSLRRQLEEVMTEESGESNNTSMRDEFEVIVRKDREQNAMSKQGRFIDPQEIDEDQEKTIQDKTNMEHDSNIQKVYENQVENIHDKTNIEDNPDIQEIHGDHEKNIQDNTNIEYNPNMQETHGDHEKNIQDNTNIESVPDIQEIHEKNGINILDLHKTIQEKEKNICHLENLLQEYEKNSFELKQIIQEKEDKVNNLQKLLEEKEELDKLLREKDESQSSFNVKKGTKEKESTILDLKMIIREKGNLVRKLEKNVLDLQIEKEMLASELRQESLKVVELETQLEKRNLSEKTITLEEAHKALEFKTKDNPDIQEIHGDLEKNIIQDETNIEHVNDIQKIHEKNEINILNLHKSIQEKEKNIYDLENLLQENEKNSIGLNQIIEEKEDKVNNLQKMLEEKEELHKLLREKDESQSSSDLKNCTKEKESTMLDLKMTIREKGNLVRKLEKSVLDLQIEKKILASELQQESLKVVELEKQLDSISVEDMQRNLSKKTIALEEAHKALEFKTKDNPDIQKIHRDLEKNIQDEINIEHVNDIQTIYKDQENKIKERTNIEHDLEIQKIHEKNEIKILDLHKTIQEKEKNIYDLENLLQEYEKNSIGLNQIIQEKEDKVINLQKMLEEKEELHKLLREKDEPQSSSDVKKSTKDKECTMLDLKMTIREKGNLVRKLEKSVLDLEIEKKMLTSELQQESLKVIELEKQLDSISVEDMQRNLSEKTIALEEAHKALEIKTKELATSQMALENKTKKLNVVQSNFEEKLKEFNIIQTSLEEKSAEFSLLQKRFEQKSKELDVIQSTSKERSKEFDIVQKALEEKSKELDNIQRTLLQKSKELDVTQNALEEKSNELEMMRKSMEQTSNVLASLQTSILDNNMLQKELTDIQESHQRAQQELDLARVNFEKKCCELELAQRSLQEKTKALDETQQCLQEKSNALEAIERNLVEKSKTMETTQRNLEDKSKALEVTQRTLHENSTALNSMQLSLLEKTKILDTIQMTLDEKSKELELIKRSGEENLKELQCLKKIVQEKEALIIKLREELKNKGADSRMIFELQKEKAKELGVIQKSLQETKQALDLAHVTSRELQLNLHIKIRTLEESNSVLDSKRKEFEETIHKMQKDLQEMTKELHNTRNRLEVISQELDTTRKKLETTTHALDTLQKNMEVTTQTLGVAQRNLGETMHALDATSRQLSEQTMKVDRLKHCNQEKEQVIIQLKEQIESNKVDPRAMYELQKSLQQQQEAEKQKFKGLLRERDERIQTLNSQIKSNENELRNRDECIYRLSDELNQLKNGAGGFAALRNELEEKDTCISGLKIELDKINSNQNEKKKITEFSDRLDECQSVVSNYEVLLKDYIVDKYKCSEVELDYGPKINFERLKTKLVQLLSTAYREEREPGLMSEDVEKLKEEKECLNEKVHECYNRIMELDHANSNLRMELAEKNQTLRKYIEKGDANVVMEVDEGSSNMHEIAERQKLEITDLKLKVDELQENNEHLDAEVLGCLDRIKELERIIDAREATIKEIETNCEHGELMKELNRYKSVVNDLEETIFKLKEENKDLDYKVADYMKKKHTYKENIRKLKGHIAEKEKSGANCSSCLRLKMQMNSLQQRLKQQDTNIASEQISQIPLSQDNCPDCKHIQEKNKELEKKCGKLQQELEEAGKTKQSEESRQCQEIIHNEVTQTIVRIQDTLGLFRLAELSGCSTCSSFHGFLGQIYNRVEGLKDKSQDLSNLEVKFIKDEQRLVNLLEMIIQEGSLGDNKMILNQLENELKMRCTDLKRYKTVDNLRKVFLNEILESIQKFENGINQYYDRFKTANGKSDCNSCLKSKRFCELILKLKERISTTIDMLHQSSCPMLNCIEYFKMLFDMQDQYILQLHHELSPCQSNKEQKNSNADSVAVELENLRVKYKNLKALAILRDEKLKAVAKLFEKEGYKVDLNRKPSEITISKKPLLLKAEKKENCLEEPFNMDKAANLSGNILQKLGSKNVNTNSNKTPTILQSREAHQAASGSKTPVQNVNINAGHFTRSHRPSYQISDTNDISAKPSGILQFMKNKEAQASNNRPNSDTQSNLRSSPSILQSLKSREVNVAESGSFNVNVIHQTSNWPIYQISDTCTNPSSVSVFQLMKSREAQTSDNRQVPDIKLNSGPRPSVLELMKSREVNQANNPNSNSKTISVLQMMKDREANQRK